MAVCPRSGISPRVGFDGDELLAAGENDGVIRDKVEVEMVLDLEVVVVVVVVAVVVVGVVKIVGVVGVQREHAVECGIEGEVA